MSNAKICTARFNALGTALLPKFCLMPEGANEAGTFATDTAQGMGRPARELPKIAGAQVRQLVLFPVSLDVMFQ